MIEKFQLETPIIVYRRLESNSPMSDNFLEKLKEKEEVF